MAAIPNDPLLAGQWNVTSGLGGVKADQVWPDYTGAGTSIAFVESGIAPGNPDLDPGFRLALSWNYLGGVQDPRVGYGTGHGEAVAGVAVGAANGTGIVGIAYGAEWGVVTYGGLAHVATGISDSALKRGVDVINNSWGWATPWADMESGWDVKGLLGSMAAASTQGREGLGSVLVFAAGNNGVKGDQTGSHAILQSIHAVTVAGIDSAGHVLAVSTPGAAVLVSAGASSFYSTNYQGTAMMGAGTSYAAPAVSAVSSLALDANSGLGARDIHEILALSASLSYDAPSLRYAAKTNDAMGWNGGGMVFSNSVGFGVADARAAVRLAETRFAVGATAETFGNATTLQTVSGALSVADGGSGSANMSLALNAAIQKVQLTVTFSLAPTDSAFGFELVSASGTKSTLFVPILDLSAYGGVAQAPSGTVMTFESNAFWGEDAAGTWSLAVKDAKVNGAGLSISGLKLTVTGDAPAASDRFYFTDDFQALVTKDPTRATLAGHAGGRDTLDFSAFTAAVTLDFDAKSFTAGGTAVHVSAADVVANALGGDGADVIRGDASGNVIWGGRGNDTLVGGAGNDTLRGASGDDSIDGGDGTEDVVLYANDASFYTVTKQADGSVTVRQTGVVTGPSDGQDTLRNVEFIRFGSKLEAPDACSSEVALGAPRPQSILSVSDGSLREGDSGTAAMSFVVSLDRASSAPLTVRYATANGTATSGSDYDAASGTVTFAAGEMRKEIAVAVRGDLAYEGDERFLFNLSSPTGAVIGRVQATGTIVDNDPVPPVVSVADFSVVEGAAGTKAIVGFVVTLSNASALPVKVSYATQAGTAAVGTDFVGATGVLTFAPGETTKTVPVTVLGDATFETNETFSFSLSAPSAATLGRVTATATIGNDESAPQINVADVRMAEGGGPGTMTFTVSLSGASALPVAVSWSTTDGTAKAGSDYVAGSGTLTFNPGELSKTVAVKLSGDGLVESDEAFGLVLSSPTGGVIGRGTASGTLTNDDVAPTLSVADIRVIEGAAGTTAKANFTVTLSRAYAEAVTVAYTTSDGTATGGAQGADGVDYLAAAGTVTFEAGQTSKVVTVSVLGDRLIETDEAFKLLLSSPTNATLAKATATAIIGNDDLAPTVAVLAPSVMEASGKATFTLTLSRVCAEDYTISWATKDGTALAGPDYRAGSGTVTFAAGETTKTVEVALTDDRLFEANETFGLTLSTTSIAKLPALAPTVTILNDDVLSSLSVSDVSVTEGGAGSGATAVFAVKLSTAYGVPVTVAYATKGGTAVAGSDFEASSGTLTFEAGETQKSVAVKILGDSLAEATETLQLSLSAPVNATLLKAAGTATILDDDKTPVVSVVGGGMTEEGKTGSANHASFVVSLSKAYDAAVTVSYATTAQTASVGSDFTATNGKLTFAPGETSRTFDIDILGDNLAEANETFQFVISAPVNATLGASAATATIVNDDTAPVLSVGDVTVSEEGVATFLVGLSKPYDAAVTVGFATKALTAFAGSDFTATSGKLTFAPGEMSKSVEVAIRSDNVAEANETFQLALSAPVNATLSGSGGTATILNHDTAPVLSVSDANVSEAGVATFLVGMSKAYDAAVSVKYASALGTAKAADLTASSGTLSFAVGETQKTISVRVTADALVEADETFRMMLSAATNATIGRASGTGTIFDDDGGHVPPSQSAHSQNDVWATLFSLPTSSGHQEWSLIG